MVRTPEVTHKIMSAIKGRDTVPELMLRKAVWHMGLRYRVNDRSVFGKPDMVFTKVKLAVFCDGDYWHGHNWALRGYKDLDEELANYKPFWAEKIQRNIDRDNEVNRILVANGWHVLRFWTSEILSDVQKCVMDVRTQYDSIRENTRKENFEDGKKHTGFSNTRGSPMGKTT